MVLGLKNTESSIIRPGTQLLGEGVAAAFGEPAIPSGLITTVSKAAIMTKLLSLKRHILMDRKCCSLRFAIVATRTISYRHRPVPLNIYRANQFHWSASSVTGVTNARRGSRNDIATVRIIGGTGTAVLYNVVHESPHLLLVITGNYRCNDLLAITIGDRCLRRGVVGGIVLSLGRRA